METVLFAPNVARPSVHAAFCAEGSGATVKPVAVAFIVQEMPAMPQDQAPDCTRQPEPAAHSAASERGCSGEKPVAHAAYSAALPTQVAPPRDPARR